MSGASPDAALLRTFSSAPPLWPAYARALVSRKPALAPAATRMPALQARLAGQRSAPARLQRYREVCGFAGAACMPITWPHVLAFPLHMALLTAPAFPVRLLGLVHVANRITRHQDMGAEQALDLDCRLPGLRETERGQEFELSTEAHCAGQLVWSETSTFLARRRAPVRTAAAPPDATALPQGHDTATWHAAADIGRRYARVSGDINPIHLSTSSARLFGFQRAIAHGMWSLARAAAQLESASGRHIVELDAAFKLPVLLPAQVRLHTWEGPQESQYVLTDAHELKPHMSGKFRLL